jgi:hypothetical protein
VQKIRDVCADATGKKLDDILSIFEWWVQFERLTGTWETLYSALSVKETFERKNPLAYIQNGMATLLEDNTASQRKRPAEDPASSMQTSKKPKRNADLTAESEKVTTLGEHYKAPATVSAKVNIADFKPIKNSNAGNMIYISPLEPKTTYEMLQSVFTPVLAINPVRKNSGFGYPAQQ